ncbi:MAG: SurA N-terminal domain-containing protein, partial [Planctomycetaceae bacterium]|nr:SurA N-terminal domain-containing protein [Planctomycetaceae bacterium]
IDTVCVNGAPLSAHDLFSTLRRNLRLKQILREMITETLVSQKATELGVNVSDKQLQKAADSFRRKHRLHSAERTEIWFRENGINAATFEASIETNVRKELLIDAMFAEKAVEEFRRNPQMYARVNLAIIQVPSDELARELRMQIECEGAEFAELAAHHSVHESRFQRGRVGHVFVTQLPKAIQPAFWQQKGKLIGPVTTDEGSWIAQVESYAAPDESAATLAFIKARMFEEWIAGELVAAKIEVPLLDVLEC